MIVVAALLLIQAMAVPVQNRDIVVTARPLAETERAWQACMARRCSPDEEIAAALAHAENQFVGGAYLAARTTLNTTIGHVRGRERDYPVQIGSIWRAKSRIEANLGETDRVQVAAVMSHQALKAGLGPDDPQTLGQSIGVGDALLQIGRLRQALAAYQTVASRAGRLGLKREQGHAMLRIASVWTTLATGRVPSGPARDMARAAIARITATIDPDLAGFREAGEMLAAKLDARGGDSASIDRLIARYRDRSTEKPVLIYAPAIDEFEKGAAPVPVIGTTGSTATNSFEDQWADVSFRIAPDGTVMDADVLRSSDKNRPGWIEPVLRVVRGRRYAPLKASADPAGLSRIERVTYTSDYFMPTSSRIRMRSGMPRIVFTDLTMPS